MFKEKDGKEWSSEENFLKFKQHLAQILEIQLALENYADDTQNNAFYSNESFALLSDLRKNKQVWEEEKLLSTADKILAEFNKILENLGKENFIFYNDGTIEYNYQK